MIIFKIVKSKYFLNFAKISIIFSFVVFLNPLQTSMSPFKPSNTSPSNAQTNVSLTPTLTSSAFDHPNDSVTASSGIIDRVGTNHFTGVNTIAGSKTSTSNGVSTERVTLVAGNSQSITNTSPTYQNDSKTGGKTLSIWFELDTLLAANGNMSLFRVSDGSSTTNSGFWNFRVFRNATDTGGNNRIGFQRRVENGSTFSPANLWWGNTNLSAGTLYHVVLSTDGTRHRVYLNGSLQNLNNATVAGGDWWGDTNLSFPPTVSTIGIVGFLNGKVDEITYWDKELTVSEITELYNSGVATNPRNHSAAANLISYWQMGEKLLHKASQWQITENSGNYSSTVFDSGTDTTNLTSINIPGSTLDEGVTYYWRVRHQDETDEWSDWSDETSFTTENTSAGTLDLEIIDENEDPIINPFVSMNDLDFSFTSQTATGTLGTSSQKIRVNNGTGTATWTLSLAADDGSSALWSSGSNFYDFNDPTVNAGDGADADSYGGQMTVNPGIATITPQSGCTDTSVSTGSSTSFNEGVTDSITLASASSGADTNCYWDITGIGVSQTIPAEQPAGSYSINMTLSIIAS